MKRRQTIVLWLLILALPLAALTGITLGFGSLSTPGILALRVTRVSVALLVGAALSVAGVILQAVLRNPLADPYVLGISAGGGLGAVLVIVILPAAVLWQPAAAFAGAVLTIFLVYSLARVGGRVPVHSLLLSGVVVGAVLGSLLMFLVSVSNAREMKEAIWWLLGDLGVRDIGMLGMLGGAVVVGVGAAVLFGRDLNVMALGEEPAAHLGLHVERMKIVFFVISSLITAATVATCGLIGFVGLIVPHILRRLVGPDHRRLVPACALGGAAFLVLADTLARVVRQPLEVPIGVVTAFLGGPFFLFLLRRGRRRTWG